MVTFYCSVGTTFLMQLILKITVGVEAGEVSLICVVRIIIYYNFSVQMSHRVGVQLLSVGR